LRRVTYDLPGLRATEFPWADSRIWLDHASIGPLPERTRRALEETIGRRCRPYELTAADQFGGLARARSAIAGLIGAEPAEIALATNTSFGLAIAARALPLGPGDVVLVSDKEFPANVYPWRRLGDRGVRCELVPVTPEGWPDEARLMERLHAPEVRAIAVSLTQFASGYTVDLAQLSALTRQLGKWLVVDAIQGVGQLPLDLRATPVDLLACGAQKWLLSPWGSGFLYVRQSLIGQLDPAITGWMNFEGTDDFAHLTDYHDALRTDARRFELITLPFQEFVALNQSLSLLTEIGIPAIQTHLAALQRQLLAWADARGVPVSSPRGARGSGITCLVPPRIEAAHRALREAGIYCSLREGALRMSPHCYNTAAEMERVTEVLGQHLG
jgi:cysteine desulfurase/selenocysteine lyase